MTTTAVVTSRVIPKTVNDAVTSLLKWKNDKSKTEKAQLLEQDEFLYLIVALNKIPEKNRTNFHRIPLPHPLINTEEESPELCLIIDDRPNKSGGLTKKDAKKKIDSEDIPITKVLKLWKLGTDYKDEEEKRKLFDSYDMFFADPRVIPMLPGLVGKKFFVQKKIPLPVDLKHRNWKQQIEKGCGSAMFFVSAGTSSVVRVGKLSMEREEIVENVMAALNGVVEFLPGQWKYVRSLHLKRADSVSLPIYQCVPALKVKVDASEEKSVVVKEEKKKKEKSVVKVEKKTKGKSEFAKGKKKGRRVMDSNVSEVVDEDEEVRIESSGVKEVKMNKRKRKKEGSVVDDDDDAEKPKKKVAKGKLKEKSNDELKLNKKRAMPLRQFGCLKPKSKKSVVRK